MAAEEKWCSPEHPARLEAPTTMAMPEGTMKFILSTSSSSDVTSVSDCEKFCYDKEILLSLRKVPASLTRPDYLSKEFDSSDGFWDPDRWHKSQSGCTTPQQRPSAGSDGVPKGVPPRVKGDEDSNIVLGPQRRSFGLGCHVAPASKDQAERGKQNGFAAADSKEQRFVVSDSAGREHGQRLEKRSDLRKAIGSGRLQQIPSYDHRGGDGTKITSNLRADQEPTWRRDESNPLFNRAAGDNAKHFGSSKAPGLKSTRDEPEWFTADISQTDVIELHGFDASEHANTNTTRAPNKKLRPSTDLSKAAKVERPSTDKSTSEVKLLEVSFEADVNSKKEAAPQAQGAAAFDLNKFFEDFTVSIGSLQGEAANREVAEATLLVSSREGSRFSRWFGGSVTETGEQTAQPSAMDSSVPSPPSSPAIASSVSNLFKQWDSQEKSGRTAVGNVPTSHQSAVPSSNITLDLTSNLKSLLLHNSQEHGHEHPCFPERSELPAELIKLYGHMEARPLPSDQVHTVDEIESAIVTEKHPVNKGSKQLTEKNEMPAFQKLVDMLQNAGELNRSMPRMPEEVATAHHVDLPTTNVQPSLQTVPVFEASSCSPCIPSSSPVPESHRRSLVDAWLRSSDYQEPSLAQALEHSPADSPLMFSTQPPGHVAMPAPIHPMQQPAGIHTCRKTGSSYEMLASSLPQTAVAQSGSAFVKPSRSSIENEHSMNHSLDMHFSTSFKHRDDDRTILNSLTLSEPSSRPTGAGAPHVPAGFTPTSVMRKQASSKVDKRERLRHDPSQDAGTLSSVGSPQHPSPAISYGSDQWHNVLHSQQQAAVYPVSVAGGSDLAAPVPDIASLMPQAGLATSSHNGLPLDLQHELGQHVAVSLPTPTPSLGVLHQQTGYNSFNLPLLQQSGALLHHQLPLGGLPPVPAVFGVNAQLPVRRAILKSGTEMMPNGLSQIPPQHLQQQPLLDQSRLVHASPESNVMYILQQQQLQLRLQHQQRAALSGIIPGPPAQSLLTPIVSSGVPRQLPIQTSAELAPMGTVPGLGYRSPLINRQHPMTMPQIQGIPVHLNSRTDPPGIPSEPDPLHKWFGNSFLQQMSAVPPPQKLGCAMTVDDLEAL